MVMKIDMLRKVLVIMTLVGAVAIVGCDKKCATEPAKTPGTAERAGAALDKAVEKTQEVTTNALDKAVEATKAAAEATKDATGRVVEKTGQALEKAGTAVEKTGADLQK